MNEGLEVFVKNQNKIFFCGGSGEESGGGKGRCERRSEVFL